MSWAQVWGRREPAAFEGESELARLIAADGMDSPFGKVQESAWRAYVARIAAALKIEAGSTVFDVGCGAGAFLYPLFEQGVTVAGLDQAESMVAHARRLMPGMVFEASDAAALDASQPYDVVLSSAAFLYFPTLVYSRAVLEKMAAKARRAVAVLDAPDAAVQAEALAVRRGLLGASEYEEKYRGLDHLYFERGWIEAVLRGCGFTRFRCEAQQIEGYANAAHRFNVMAFRD
jgi:SAM-dependent methyltransferase